MTSNFVGSHSSARRRLLACVFLIPTFAITETVTAGIKLPPTAQQLRDRIPGAQVRVFGEGELAIFGRPLYQAPTPEQAAAGFLARWGDALGVTAPDLRIEWQADLGSGHARVFAYRQYIEDLPVEHAIARLLVYNGPQSAVVYASGRLVNVPVEGLDGGDSDGSGAVATVRSLPDYAGLIEWSTPQLVVYAGEADSARRRPILAWKFSAHTAQTTDFFAYTFFVSARTGRLVHARNEVYNGAPISGQVTGMGSPGVFPDKAGNPPAELPIPDLDVRIDDGPSATTDVNGHFVLDSAGATVNLVAELAGPWVHIADSSTSPPLLEQEVTPPGPGDFLFNPVPSEFTTAHVNAMIHASLTHDFFKQRQPGFNGLDHSIRANTNISSTCNAFFTPIGTSINFFGSGGGCVNTAYSSVVAHEYGHYIVNQLSLAQGAFGEGFGDCIAILQYDDPVVGHDFFGPGTFVRNIPAADQQYPCFSENHTCGQVLAGAWWDIKLGLQASLGAESGLETARQLFTDWSLITLGGKFRNSADARTAIEVLTADDDDGNLENGTPHYDEICNGFAAHNISCSGSCAALGRIRASCRRGTISMSVSTGPPGGTPITFLLDGDDSQTVNTNLFGRATARWHSAGSGPHEVCVEDCEDSCRAVTCTP